MRLQNYAHHEQWGLYNMEAINSSNSSEGVFAARDAELRDTVKNMPVPISVECPYLMEIATGYVHPYTKSMAERSDLVVPCYTLQGSMDPADADPLYDPQSDYTREERRQQIKMAPPQTAAEKKAAAAAAEKALRAKIEAEVRAKVEAEMRAKLAGENSAPAKSTRAEVKTDVSIAVPSSPNIDAAIMEAIGGTESDIDSVFAAAMRE